MAGRGEEALLRADDPAIHVLAAAQKVRRGCPRQARAWRPFQCRWRGFRF